MEEEEDKLDYYSIFGLKCLQICNFMGGEGCFLIYNTKNCETTILAWR